MTAMFRIKRYQSYSLRTALLVFMLTPFLIIMALSSGYILNTLEAQAEASMQEDIELIARAIRVPLSYALENDRNDMVQQTLSSAFDIRRVYGIHVYDKDGQRVATGGSSKAFMQDKTAAAQVALAGEQGAFEESEGEPVFSYFVPLTGSGERITGLLQVTRRGSDFTRYIDHLRVRALAVLAVTGVLFLLVIYLGYHYAVGRHMRNMRQSMGRVAAGEARHRISVRGPWEIRYLGSGINAMLDDMAASAQEISLRREQQHQLERQLHQSEKLAAIGRLAAGVAHELGTPLSVADGKAQRGLRSAEGSSRDTLLEIRQQLRRMTQTVRQLMDFSRTNALQNRSIKVLETVHLCLSQLEPERQTRKVAVQLVQDPGDITLRGDPLRLEQAVSNLILNALQAARGQVRISWQRDACKHLLLCVDDDGEGIPADKHDKIFEPFFTTKAVGEGTGLGLAIVASVAAEHCGQVSLHESDLGGARFQLRLPIDQYT